eukprot:TRINITY_DN2882_c0_g2_i2.p1 TRINITY_DN2882_c0_g2~~TRINITY_DN2882_c0_g2_i2.p1  ORF type:complete len:570 (-),score=140.70 TRINITY_DN2882_c0_g2_i2:109-1818(-)
MAQGKDVMIFSNSIQRWLPGVVDETLPDGSMKVKYQNPDGNWFAKMVPAGVKEVHFVTPDAPQPPMASGAPTAGTNAVAIASNKAAMYKLDARVMHNKFLAYEARSMIEENRWLILKNYSAAFTGNRQLANMNTDKIFQNRATILGALKCEGAVQVNFRNSMLNEAKITYLEHRAALNSKVIEVNEELADINTKLIEVNSGIMAGNQAIVDFNAQNIEVNGQFLSGSLNVAGATPETNAERIAKNRERANHVLARAEANSANFEATVAKIGTNRTSIMQNAEAIYERRKGIEENHKKMMANADKIAHLLESSITTAETEDAGASAAASTNAQNIMTNKAKLFELEDQVMHNKFLAYEIRAMIEENRAAILKNYAAAFMGNRQMANSNTDSIFKNRYAILGALKCSTDVQENFRGSMMNEAKITFLEHRSQMNTRVGEVNDTLSDINARLIEVNRKIMAGNESVVQFNTEQIAMNTHLLDGSLDPSKATPESNAQRIQSNSEGMLLAQERARTNGALLMATLEKVKANRAKIQENAAAIQERAARIEGNHESMRANAGKIHTLILTGTPP